MKSILTILFACAALTGFGQVKRYYKVEYYYTTECSSGTARQISLGDNAYEQIRASAAEWMLPYKLKTFRITSYDRITKKQYDRLNRVEKFRCLPKQKKKVKFPILYLPIRWDTITRGVLLDSNRMDTTFWYRNGKVERHLVKPNKAPVLELLHN